MTRVFLAGVGTGFTLGVVLLALVDTRTCIALSFAGAVAFTVGVMVCAGGLTLWIGKTMGWLTVTRLEHSQPLDGPKDSSPY